MFFCFFQGYLIDFSVLDDTGGLLIHIRVDKTKWVTVESQGEWKDGNAPERK